jgi:peptidyl-prolyl cis-trans isomerase C
MITINGQPLPDEAIAREAALHGGAKDPEDAARRALAVRELLLQRAGELGMLEGGAARSAVAFADRDAEDAVIAALLDAEVRTPEPTDAECRRYFAAHPDRFTSGELVEASHILFAVTPGTPVAALRAQAERTLAEVAAEPSRFAERARELSNCPSAAQGGNLGQFGPGAMVPEFDRAVFGTRAAGVLPALATTRYGFHVVRVERRIPGRVLDFDVVRQRIADYLKTRAEERALRQYVAVLAGRAQVTGVELAAAPTPLVQ